MFLDEFSEALALLIENPKLGRFFADIDGMEVKEYLLQKSQQWLYFSIEDEGRVLVVQTIWGAKRGEPPEFE